MGDICDIMNVNQTEIQHGTKKKLWKRKSFVLITNGQVKYLLTVIKQAQNTIIKVQNNILKIKSI